MPEKIDNIKETINLTESTHIVIKGARVHNLKNIDVLIPRNKFVVITGVSGSGKSSLAFDTLYAEGQRRYVESLSSYARQFLGRINKPDVDFIKGIPPAVAIEQKVNTRNPRSTVGTSTEIYDYLKLLFARIGKTYSPISGKLVKRHSISDVVDYILAFPLNTKIIILSPIVLNNGRTFTDHLEILQKQGFTRIELNYTKSEKSTILISEALDNPKLLNKFLNVNLVVDRLKVDRASDNISRMSDSIQTAFYEGHGECIILIQNNEQEIYESFSNRFEEDGIIFEEPTIHSFSFNNPYGACPRCEGYGNIIGIDEDLVIPNKSLSVYQDAIACWRGDIMSQWKQRLIDNASKFSFPIHRPVLELTDEQIKLLWTGNKYFDGLDSFFKMLEAETYKIQYRVMLARYRGKTVCPDCMGTRLKKEASWVKVGGKSIHELVLLPINEFKVFFEKLELDEHEKKVSKRILIEIKNRSQYLCDVGLGYLNLNRLSSTLSGGESQRINLATSLGSSLVGSLYILDEPSIGLHPRDTERLIGVLRKLQSMGNTVVVVEHDEEIMKSADQIIDIGPFAGTHGGNIVFQGTHTDLIKATESTTAKYLIGTETIPIPQYRRSWSKKDYGIIIKKACENNLKHIDVKFPIGLLTVVTGVSGSGKSSLVKGVLYTFLAKHFNGYSEKIGKCGSIEGDYKMLYGVEFVDQNPIGKSSRSNPVTYIKAYDEIRKLYSDLPASKINDFKPSHFSFNIDGGRCEECQGDGVIKVEMQFMADVHLICDSCKGKRFKDEILEIEYLGKNIYDILELTVDDAIEFFQRNNSAIERKIVGKLKVLSEVGMGYVKLGQSSNTLSGGESQRIKLASFLSIENNSKPTLYIFDEPTTGLHFHDIKKLLSAFYALLNQGHTIIIIEHNPDIIKCADWVIDLGPDGGENGGYIVFEGKPEDLVICQNSYTGKSLRKKLDRIN